MKRIFWLIVFARSVFCSAGFEIKNPLLNFDYFHARMAYKPVLPIIFFKPNDTIPSNKSIYELLATRLSQNPDCKIKLTGYISVPEQKGVPRVQYQFAVRRAELVCNELKSLYPDLADRFAYENSAYDYKFSPFDADSLNSRIEAELEFPAVGSRVIYTKEKGKMWADYLDAVVLSCATTYKPILLRNPGVFVLISGKNLPPGEDFASVPLNRLDEIRRKFLRFVGKEFKGRVLVGYDGSTGESEGKAEISLTGEYSLYEPMPVFDPGDSLVSAGDDSLYFVCPAGFEHTSLRGWVSSQNGLLLHYLDEPEKNLPVVSLLSLYFSPFERFRFYFYNPLDTPQVVTSEFRFNIRDFSLLSRFPLVLFVSGEPSETYPRLAPMVDILSNYILGLADATDSVRVTVEGYATELFGVGVAKSRAKSIEDLLKRYLALSGGVESDKIQAWLLKKRISIDVSCGISPEPGIFGNWSYITIASWRKRR